MGVLLVGAIFVFLLLLLEEWFPVRHRTAFRLFRYYRTAALWIVGSWLASFVLGWFQSPHPSPFQEASWIHIAVGVVAGDFLDYVFHRISHRVHWLWRLHQIHHVDSDLDVGTAFLGHPVSDVFIVCLRAEMFFLLGLSPYEGFVAAFVLVFAAAYSHANFKNPAALERALNWLIVTPNVHHSHHSQKPEDQAANFGNVFSVWDHVFGTYRYSAEASVLGLLGTDSRRYGFWKLFFLPFQRKSQIASELQLRAVSRYHSD